MARPASRWPHYMQAEHIDHPSDALAEWLLNNGQELVLLKKSWALNEDLVVDLLKDSHTLANVSDSGAHGKLFCGAGYSVFVLTEFVRDRQCSRSSRACTCSLGGTPNSSACTIAV